MDGTVIDADMPLFNDEASDSESITYAPIADDVSENRALIHLVESSDEHINLKHQFLQSMGSLAEGCSVVAIRRMVHCISAKGRARLEAFRLYVKAAAEKNGGDPNVKLGWYGASFDGICRIGCNGFGSDGIPTGTFGFGFCVYAGCSAKSCVMSSAADENGSRHLVLCRVILGKTEQVLPGSKQYGPSSDEFDSGVDNQKFPKKYIVWYIDAKTHVLPLYVLTIKLDFKTKGRLKEPAMRPCSAWISFSILISSLSKCLSSTEICLIKKIHIKYMERRISRLQLVTHVRKIVGDELLISVIKKISRQYISGYLIQSLLLQFACVIMLHSC